MTPRQTQALQREWERNREYQNSIYAEIHATLRNTALGKGWKPLSGELWTADMFLPDYQAKPAQPDWQGDKAALMGNVKKIKAQAKSFTAEGRAAIKRNQQNLKITAERRRHAETMKAEGATPARIKEYLTKGR